MFNESFEKWCINQGYVELAPSPLIRNDNHLFTFSPFEDLEDNYLEEKRFKGFKVRGLFSQRFSAKFGQSLVDAFAEAGQHP